MGKGIAFPLSRGAEGDVCHSVSYVDGNDIPLDCDDPLVPASSEGFIVNVVPVVLELDSRVDGVTAPY